jgi:diadenylate cyclase
MIELFKIGFLSVTLLDIIDIAVVTILFFFIYKAIKNTIAIQVFFGLVIIFGLSFIAEAINLKSINWILRLLSDIWIIAFIIIFQQEIRKVIIQFTRNPIFHLFVKKGIMFSIDEIVEAAIELSKHFTGALIVFPQTQDVSISSIDGGVPIDAVASKELILSIFNTKAPLHDGAIIIDNKLRITTARCILPLSTTRRIGNRLLGTRHRAGLGLTEKIDAVVLIVSEETGSISIAQRGNLEIGIPAELLRKKLNEKISE